MKFNIDEASYRDSFIRYRKGGLVGSCLLILTGFVFVLLISKHFELQKLILFVLFAIGYGGIVGYFSFLYDCAVSHKEIKYWVSIHTWNPWDFLFGRKWYSWLFYLMIVLLLTIGIPIQMILFLPKSDVSFALFTFASMFMTMGSFSLIYSISLKPDTVLSKLKDRDES